MTKTFKFLAVPAALALLLTGCTSPQAEVPVERTPAPVITEEFSMTPPPAPPQIATPEEEAQEMGGPEEMSGPDEESSQDANFVWDHIQYFELPPTDETLSAARAAGRLSVMKWNSGTSPVDIFYEYLDGCTATGMDEYDCAATYAMIAKNYTNDAFVAAMEFAIDQNA